MGVGFRSVASSIMLAWVAPLVAVGEQESPTAAPQLRALMLADQPADGSNGVDALGPLTLWVRQTIQAVAAEQSPPFDPERFRFAELGDPTEREDAVRMTFAVMERLISNGLDDRVGALATSPRWVRDVAGAWTDETDGISIATEARLVGRLNLTRMRLAAQRGEWDAWARAFDDGLAIGALIGRDFSMYAYLSGRFMYEATLHEITRHRSVSATHALDARVINAIDASIRTHGFPDFRRVVEARRIVAHENLRLIYEGGPEVVAWVAGERQGPKPASRPSVPPGPNHAAEKPTPTLRLDANSIDRYFDDVQGRLGRTILFARSAPRLIDRLYRSGLVHVSPSPADVAVTGSIHFQARVASAAALVALERYRHDHGTYPEAITDLVPNYLADLVDPSTARAFGYLPPSSGPYPGARAFVLYSCGPDGIDDNGKVDFDLTLPLYRGERGDDVLLNW